MSDIRMFFAEGGIFMYLLILHLVVWICLSWTYLGAVIVRGFRIGSRARRFETACGRRDASSALREADANPGDRMGQVVAAAARSLISGAPPERASSAARAEALLRLPGLHPLWAVSCFWLLVCCTLVTALLGALGESFGLIQSFSALAYAGQGEKAVMLAQAMTLARYPVTFSIVIMCLTAPPAVIAAVLLATFASSGRERGKALELSSALTGATKAPAPRSAGGLAGAAVILACLLIASIVLVMPSGKLKNYFSQLNQTWAETAVKKPEPPDATQLAKLSIPPSEQPGAQAETKKGKKHGEKPSAVGSLPAEVIKKVMLSHSSQIKFCYERELGTSPDVQGKIVVKFTISPKGDVSSAMVTSSTLGGTDVEDCVLKVVRRMKFPKPKGGGIVNVTYPYVFAHAK